MQTHTIPLQDRIPQWYDVFAIVAPYAGLDALSLRQVVKGPQWSESLWRRILATTLAQISPYVSSSLVERRLIPLIGLGNIHEDTEEDYVNRWRRALILLRGNHKDTKHNTTGHPTIGLSLPPEEILGLTLTSPRGGSDYPFSPRKMPNDREGDYLSTLLSPRKVTTPTGKVRTSQSLPIVPSLGLETVQPQSIDSRGQQKHRVTTSLTEGNPSKRLWAVDLGPHTLSILRMSLPPDEEDGQASHSTATLITPITPRTLMLAKERSHSTGSVECRTPRGSIAQIYSPRTTSCIKAIRLDRHIEQVRGRLLAASSYGRPDVVVWLTRAMASFVPPGRQQWDAYTEGRMCLSALVEAAQLIGRRGSVDLAFSLIIALESAIPRKEWVKVAIELAAAGMLHSRVDLVKNISIFLADVIDSGVSGCKGNESEDKRSPARSLGILVGDGYDSDDSDSSTEDDAGSEADNEGGEGAVGTTDENNGEYVSTNPYPLGSNTTLPLDGGADTDIFSGGGFVHLGHSDAVEDLLVALAGNIRSLEGAKCYTLLASGRTEGLSTSLLDRMVADDVTVVRYLLETLKVIVPGGRTAWELAIMHQAPQCLFATLLPPYARPALRIFVITCVVEGYIDPLRMCLCDEVWIPGAVDRLMADPLVSRDIFVEAIQSATPSSIIELLDLWSPAPTVYITILEAAVRRGSPTILSTLIARGEVSAPTYRDPDSVVSAWSSLVETEYARMRSSTRKEMIRLLLVYTTSVPPVHLRGRLTLATWKAALRSSVLAGNLTALRDVVEHIYLRELLTESITLSRLGRSKGASNVSRSVCRVLQERIDWLEE